MKENKQGCDLKSCYLCRHCLEEWIPAVAANRKTYQVKRGETVFKEGEEMKGMFFVYEGAVKVHKKWDADKELIVRFAKKGDIVGHRGLGSDSYYPITATALEASLICYVDLPFFESSLKVNYELIHELMMFFAKELKTSERNMRNLAHMPVKGRVVTALILLKEKFGTDENGAINLTLSRQDLASFTGTTYETVFRILSELVSLQIIQYTEKRITVTDINRLITIASDTGGT
jgi:CRP/FNR family transcriptional regulator